MNPKTFTGLVLFILAGLPLAHAGEYKTSWRGHFGLASISFSVPLQYDGQLLHAGISYKWVGIETGGFRLAMRGLDDEDSVELLGHIAPIYIYGIPFTSHRKGGDILPMAMFLYAGGSPWGLKNSMMLDFGIGFDYYVAGFRFGYKAVSADSRFCFGENISRDHEVRWNTLYFTINLTPGYWISFKSNPSSGKSNEE